MLLMFIAFKLNPGYLQFLKVNGILKLCVVKNTLNNMFCYLCVKQLAILLWSPCKMLTLSDGLARELMLITNTKRNHSKGAGLKSKQFRINTSDTMIQNWWLRPSLNLQHYAWPRSNWGVLTYHTTIKNWLCYCLNFLPISEFCGSRLSEPITLLKQIHD